MKKMFFFLLFPALLLSACLSPSGDQPAPQTDSPLPPREGTQSLPSPTLGEGTGVRATPTLHPEFIALQQTIAATGERFILQADGTIWDNESAAAVQGLRVDNNGVMTIMVNGEEVTLDPADVTWDDEGGVKVKGYDLDENGDWVKAQAAYTIEQLAAMTDAEKIAAAPSIAEMQASGQIAAEVDPAKVAVRVEAGHVVTYTYENKHIATYDLRLGITADQMAYAEYGKEMIQRAFYDFRWDYPGYTPSLEEREMLSAQRQSKFLSVYQFWYDRGLVAIYGLRAASASRATDAQPMARPVAE